MMSTTTNTSTSQTPELFTEILADRVTPIPEEKLAYFRRRLRLQLHELVVEKFYRQETMTQRDLANRIGKTPDVVNRMLGAPGNWTLDTVSDLLIAMAAVPAIEIDNVEDLLPPKLDEQRIEAMLPKREKRQPEIRLPVPTPRNSAQERDRPQGGMGT
jgi:hypothetical protein